MYYRANLARDVADMREAATKEDKLKIYSEVSKAEHSPIDPLSLIFTDDNLFANKTAPFFPSFFRANTPITLISTELPKRDPLPVLVSIHLRK
jgi:hypothetical protein